MAAIVYICEVVKRELLERLRAALLVERERVPEEEEEEANDDGDEEDEEEEEVVDPEGDNPPNRPQVQETDDEEGAQGTPLTRWPQANRQRVLLTFKDVEGTLKKFSGDDHTDIRRWLQNFKEMAELCEWNDV